MAMATVSFSGSWTLSVGCKYLKYLPVGYEEEPAKKWPLLLFLHGAGERGDDLELVKKHGPPRRIAEGRNLPFILIAPQCPAGRTWDPHTLAAMLDSVVGQLRVDTDRIYLTGISMGGMGTWDLASEYPDRFAAIAPICGIRVPLREQSLKQLPIWCFHGAMDPVVPLSDSVRMVEAIRNAGGEVTFTVYPDAKHDAWTQTYNDPRFYEWLLEHRRSDRA